MPNTKKEKSSNGKVSNAGVYKKQPVSLWRILWVTTPIMFSSFPLYAIWMWVVSITHGLSWATQTIVQANLFNSVANAVAQNSGAMPVIKATLWMGGIAVICQALNGYSNFIASDYLLKAAVKVKYSINQKAGRIDPVQYEHPDVLDDINKAATAGNDVLSSIFVVLNILTFYGSYFALMGVFLYSLKPSLALALAVAFVPGLFSAFVKTVVLNNLEDDVAPLRRKRDYYENAISGRELFKETRLLGAFDYFKNLFLDAVAAFNAKNLAAERKSALWVLSMKVVTLIGYGIVMWMMISAVLAGEISIGSFAAVFTSLGMLFYLFEEIVNNHIGYMVRGIPLISNYIRFMELPERPRQDAKLNFDEGISIKDASFTYPGSDQPSLTDINLDIKPGETLAIVGQNGAGKSTLTKLLTGVYLPTGGEVMIGGVNTRSASPESLYEKTSGVFQNFMRYKLSLRDNITASDAVSPEQPDIAARQADVDAQSEAFPDGMETMLSREFGGVDISGGQWQRVAIARGLYRRHELIVLDEPTSAIDPLEETRVYKQFAEISSGKITVIVTHRLGSARIADRIIVMDKGRIVQTGTHEQLVAQDGEYSKLWHAQAQYYD